MWTERGMCVAYWSDFSLQGVHQFKSPRLSDMSNRLFVALFMLLINYIMFINELMSFFTLITYIATLVWLSSDLSGLKFN
jgi:hypothetical protein